MKYNAEIMQTIWSCLGKFAGSNQSEYAEHEDWTSRLLPQTLIGKMSMRLRSMPFPSFLLQH